MDYMYKMTMPKGSTRLFELVDNGIIDAVDLASMVSLWMTDEDLLEMLDSNELTERFEEYA